MRAAATAVALMATGVPVALRGTGMKKTVESDITIDERSACQH